MNILFIGPFRSTLSYQKDYFQRFLKYVSSKYVTGIIDTEHLKNKTIDIKKNVQHLFNNSNKTILFFTSGSWLGNNNNRIINHEEYYKLYDVGIKK